MLYNLVSIPSDKDTYLSEMSISSSTYQAGENRLDTCAGLSVRLGVICRTETDKDTGRQNTCRTCRNKSSRRKITPTSVSAGGRETSRLDWYRLKTG